MYKNLNNLIEKVKIMLAENIEKSCCNDFLEIYSDLKIMAYLYNNHNGDNNLYEKLKKYYGGK